MNEDTKKHLMERLKMQEQSGKVALKPYKCPAGKWTIGWGHNYQDNPLLPHIKAYFDEHREITRAMAGEQLLYDTDNTIVLAKKHCPNFYKFSEVRQAVIVNMIFNMGPGCMYWPGLRNALQHKDIEAICAQMKDSKWYRQLGGDPDGTDDGILERPEEQIAMMRTDKWQR
jgi:lysozyme